MRVAAASGLSEHVCLQQYILQNEESEDFPSSGCEEHWSSCAVPAAAEGNNGWMCSDASSSRAAAGKSWKTRFLLDFINLCCHFIQCLSLGAALSLSPPLRVALNPYTHSQDVAYGICFLSCLWHKRQQWYISRPVNMKNICFQSPWKAKVTARHRCCCGL